MTSSSVLSKNLPPLAERIRPQIFSDFYGQNTLFKTNNLIIKSIQNNKPFSFIFWGPPGTGKTTLARIYSNEFDADFFELSAISSGVKEIRTIIKKGKLNFDNKKFSILFIDEIHRFTKSQQDSLLNAIETGSIILIGATTENPSFEIISPLLSRCSVLCLNPLNKIELKKIFDRAIAEDIILSQINLSIEKKAENFILESSGGDARKMLNTLELAVSLLSENETKLHIKNIEEAIQKKNIIYDKKSQYHYDVISAFIKSIRGSDPDAAIYWLAVMLEGGEKPESIARRLVIFASEDIGNAEPYALQLATSAFDAIHKIGMPECRIILAQVTIYFSCIPKSNASYIAINSALKWVKNKGYESVPIHLRNQSNNFIKSKKNSKKYQYPHSYNNHFIKQNYFPANFSNPPKFFHPNNNGREKFLKDRLNKLWINRYK